MSTATLPGNTALTPPQIAAFERDGYVIIEGLFAPEETQAWKQIMTEAVEKSPNRPGGGVLVWMADVIHPVLRDAMAGDRMRAVLQQLIGPNFEFLSAKAVFKNQATTFATPWHADRFYWGGSRKISAWIALDDTTPANGALTVIPATHKIEFLKQPTLAGETFSERILEADVAGMPVVTAAVKRGDAIVFSDGLVHGSHPNTIGGDRWSLISTYRDASVKDESQVWKTGLLMAGQSVNGAVTGFPTP